MYCLRVYSCRKRHFVATGLDEINESEFLNFIKMYLRGSYTYTPVMIK